MVKASVLFVNILIIFADGLYIPDVALKLILGVVADEKLSKRDNVLFNCTDMSDGYDIFILIKYRFYL
jgi:hypothetical protein